MSIIIMYPKKQTWSHKVKEILPLLDEDLRQSSGKPFNRGWQNFGSLQQLGKNIYHCHLDRKNVAFWEIEKSKQDIVCKYIYIGTREKAPYTKRN